MLRSNSSPAKAGLSTRPRRSQSEPDMFASNIRRQQILERLGIESLPALNMVYDFNERTSYDAQVGPTKSS